MQEIWKPIPEMGGYYEVSNLGRVRSLTRTIKARNGREWKKKGQIIKARPMKRGEMRVELYVNRKLSVRMVHRLVAKQFVPNPDGKPFVRHRDGDKANNVASNLVWTNKHRRDNDQGAGYQGEDHPRSRLSTEEVLEIRRRRGKMTQKELAELYDVSPSHISHIQRRGCWKHLDEEEWRPIPDRPDYHVSNYGRVYSEKSDKIMKTSLDRQGYSTLHLYVDGHAYVERVHRLVMLAFVGPDERQVNHDDCDKTNNRLSNLTYMTREENVAHAKENGLYGKRRSPKAKLTEEDAHMIRCLLLMGASRSLLARQYRVKKRTIRSIQRRETWADV